MFLAGLVALVIAAAPLLRGAWDLWALTSIVLLVTCGFGLWVALKIVCGHLPLPYPNRALAWILLLAALAAASTAASPVRGLVEREWWTWLVALWILIAVPLVPEERRDWIERSLVVSAWLLAALAWYQRAFQRQYAVDASLVNPNVFAGAILMLLPLALHRGRRLLAFALVVALFWTRSLGAWVALSAMLLAFFYRRSAFAFGASLLVAGITAVAAHDKLAGASVSERLDWWRAAWEMAWERPLLGFGPGAFAHVLPAFKQGEGLSSLYVHNHFLETAAGCGLLFALAWSVWVLRRLLQSRGWAAWSLIGALLHGLVDYPLSLPANLWLFSYLLVAAQPERQAWYAVRGRLKIPLLIALIGLGVTAARKAVGPWRAEKLVLARGGRGGPEGRARRAMALHPDHPAPYDRIAKLKLEAYLELGGPSRLLEALGAKEKSVELHPFRKPAWAELAVLYRLAGRGDLASEAEARAAVVFRRRLAEGSSP